MARGSGEHFSSPSGSGQSPATKRFLVNFKLKNCASSGNFGEGNTALNNTQLEYCIYYIHLNVYAGVSIALYTLQAYRAESSDSCVTVSVRFFH